MSNDQYTFEGRNEADDLIDDLLDEASIELSAGERDPITEDAAVF